MPAEQFQKALERLVTDKDYRKEVAAVPDRLASDFPLTPGELGLLAAVWEATGNMPDVQGYGIQLCSWFACCCCGEY